AGRYFFLATNLIGEIADRKSSGFISGAASDMVAQEAAPGTIPFAHCSVILVKTGTAHHASEEAAIADGNVSCGPKAGVRGQCVQCLAVFVKSLHIHQLVEDYSSIVEVFVWLQRPYVLQCGSNVALILV